MGGPTVIGIDPGKGGALAVIRPGGEAEVHDAPVLFDGKKNRYNPVPMAMLIHQLKDGAVAAIEEVHAMPGQGVTSMFDMGYGVGLWIGLLTANGIPIHRVRPQEWKKSFALSGKDKGASILRCQELFPGAEVHLKKHDGRAEALLIAEHLRRQLS